MYALSDCGVKNAYNRTDRLKKLIIEENAVNSLLDYAFFFYYGCKRAFDVIIYKYKHLFEEEGEE